MRWHELCITLFISVCSVSAMDNLNVKFEWKEVDFDYPKPEDRQSAIDSGEFIPENNLPLGLEVWDDRVFITVPRWRSGVPASLTYINLTAPMDSPKLKPFPNWEAHKIIPNSNQAPEIVSPFRVRADKCGRLWVLDCGVDDILNTTHVYKSTQVLVYNITNYNDTLMRTYNIPKDQMKGDSFFATLVIEDDKCDDTYAYFADITEAGLVVYSWKTQTSWRITHHYFNIDPTAGEFNVSGIVFHWTDNLFGMALSAPDSEGYSTLYFHPMVSTNEFSVSTKYLRDPEIVKDKNYEKNTFHKFKLLGNRGPNAQSSVSFLDKKTGVLFYALVNLNAIACWRTSVPNYNMHSQGRVIMNNVTMVFPNDIKVDSNGNLWVLSDRLPQFMYSKLDKNEVNFRIFMASVQEAIKGTACDSKLVEPSPGIGNRFKPTTTPPNNGGATQHNCLLFVAMAAIVAFLFKV